MVFSNRREYSKDSSSKHRHGSMIKGLLIWLALGGASFFIGFALLARLIPTSRLPESSESHTPALSAQAITPQDKPTRTVPEAHSQSIIPPESNLNRGRRNIPMPSIDPADKSSESDSNIQKPQTIVEDKSDRNTIVKESNTGSASSDNSTAAEETPKISSPPKKSRRKNRHKTQHENVQNPASIDSPSEPITAVPSIEPGGDTEAPSSKDQ